ncbi:MAG: nitrogen regulation protein NR(I) [Gammaproteobacteria bacterium]
MNTRSIEVWVLDDDDAIRWVLEKALRGADMYCKGFDSGKAFVTALKSATPDVLITDVRMPDVDGLELLDDLSQSHPNLPVIVVTAHSDLQSAVAAYQGGAFEYLPKPFDIDQAVELVSRAARHGKPEEAQVRRPDYPTLIGQAPAMQEVFRSIGRLSHSSMTVLITGESGTGKELVARALHEHSPRANKPFVALNTSAISSELLESELFGHEKGSFTGADARRAGRFEQAHGGTLFLDEIGDMSGALQTRLLRVLAEGEFYRVGGQRSIQVDVRVIAATHRDLSVNVADGVFREDLYHRLNVMHIETPPLRDRREDIYLLLSHYLQVAAAELGVAAKQIASDARDALTRFDWPGNVRQLVNFCRRLTATAPGREIRLEDLPVELRGKSLANMDVDWRHGLSSWATQQVETGDVPLIDVARPLFERTLIEVALARSGGKKQKAAKLLGWGRNTLTRKIKELGVED